MRSRNPLIVALALLALAIGVACGSASEPSGGGDDAATAPVRTEQQARGFRLARVASGLGDALYVTHAPGQANRLYVVQQSGRIVILRNGRRAGTFLDVSGLISSGGERGLLGLAFHPGYARNGRFYVNYTDGGGDTQVVEYRRASSTRAKPSSARRLLSIDQPFANHNGGGLAFGPDGMLYISSGDGGSGGDPEDNGQDRGSLLGKILRIDVNRRTGGRPYGIPAANPFARGGGAPEVYSYGLRNPWRFSFDRARGDLWIADVGQNEIEEINYRAKGAGLGVNFGWNAFEGRSRFDGGGPVQGRRPTPPVAQYTHDHGCSVTGGYVYRGTRVPALRGRYIFSDYCSGTVWTMRAGPRPGSKRDDTARLGVSLVNPTSFGEGANGDVYVIGSGTLYRFVPA